MQSKRLKEQKGRKREKLRQRQKEREEKQTGRQKQAIVLELGGWFPSFPKEGWLRFK